MLLYLKYEGQTGRTTEVLRNGVEFECPVFKWRYTE